MSELVVVQYGVLPSGDYEVVARGREALGKAQELDVIEEGPIHWDGSVNYVAIGGKYAVIDDSVSDEELREIQDCHKVDEDVENDDFGCSMITSDGEIEELELMDI